MDRICYMNPALGVPYREVDRIDYYSQTASGYSLMHSQPYNPMEEAYRYALRILEDSFERELSLLAQFGIPWGDDYYRREHEIKSYYYSRRDRLESDHTLFSQQYYYGYVNSSYRSLQDSYYTMQEQQINIMRQSMAYNYTYQFLNTKETIPVPTETKKWIIISSEGPNDNPKTHTTLVDAEKEAQRLARKFPAQEFTIYETKKAYKIAEKPVDVKHFI